MEVRWEIFWIIVGASIVTLLPRVLPLVVFSRLPLPDGARRWLSYVPISVMAALVGQELLLADGQWKAIATNVELWAALPTFVVAILTRSLLGTVIVGIASVVVLRLLF